MTEREKNGFDNDALQGGETNPPPGEDEREFGAGGQRVIDTLDGDDAPHRDVDRDSTIPSGVQPSGRTKE